MSCRHSKPAREQGGAALVVAMLVFALCTALIVGLEKEFALFYQRGANSFLAEQGDAYLRGAEELAAVVLAADYEKDQQEEQARRRVRGRERSKADCPERGLEGEESLPDSIMISPPAWKRRASFLLAWSSSLQGWS